MTVKKKVINKMNKVTYFDLKTHWIHFAMHVLVGAFGCAIFAYFYGSITPVEVLLFALMTILPIIDEIMYATVHYLDNTFSRISLNYYFAGDMSQFLITLHEFRKQYEDRIIHNAFIFVSLWLVWFAAYVYAHAPIYFFISGILTHLSLDLINDQYEFGSVFSWFWPLRLIRLS